MRICADTFSLPKLGNSKDEYEDAASPPGWFDIETGTARFAVADGATEASFSKKWAKLLVNAYTGGKLESGERDAALPGLREEWLQKLSKSPLPWYAEHHIERGAFAALIGLRLNDLPDKRTWQAIGIGDSCIVHLRAGSVLAAFPLDNAEAFKASPFLLSSVSKEMVDWKETNGEWESEDSFYLMSDSLAMWFLAETDENRWRLKDIADDCTFAAFISGLRTSKALRNDDVTLIRVTVN